LKGEAETIIAAAVERARTGGNAETVGDSAESDPGDRA
jgi:hypothetical protein